MKFCKRMTAIILSIMILFLNSYTIFAYETEKAERAVIQNKYIEAIINSSNGRFSIHTLEGSPYRDRDQESKLLFIDGKEPETSFTTFKINGKDYIYGNNYSFAGLAESFISQPTQDGTISQSKWGIGDVEVTQVLEIKDNISNPQVGNVKVSYTVKNNGDKAAEIGARILLDTMLGNNDGAPLMLSEEETPLRFEKEFIGDDVPDYWRSVDSTSSPNVISYGLIDLPMRTKPNRVVIAHWNALSKSKWDYSLNPQRSFASSSNDFGTSDSAVALYWNPENLMPGESQVFETYYGLGDFLQEQESNFHINIDAPFKLTLDGDAYLEKEFVVSAEIDNTLTESTPLSEINVALELPEGISLADGENQIKTIDYVPIGSITRVQWKVVPDPAPNLRVLELKVRAYSQTIEENSRNRFIILPGIGGELPELYYQGYMPGMLYGRDENKSIHIMGKGFELLSDLDKWELSLENKITGEKYYPKRADIEIVNSKHLSIGMPQALDPGYYILKMDHQLYGSYIFNSLLGISNDSSLASRDYGILTIRNSGGDNYIAEMFENEAAINTNAALTIRGKVREIEKDNMYEVIPNDTVTINSIAKYKGGTIQVFREGNTFKVKGDGTLTINTKASGQNLDLKLQRGKFVIDSDSLTLSSEAGYVQYDNFENVGGLPIVINTVKFDGNGVKIAGDLQLPIEKISKLFMENYFESLGGYLENIGINSNGIEYVGEIEIPFPHWKLGSFQSKYKKITLSINTKTQNYGLKTVMMNRPLKLNNINTTLMFKRWEPQYFKFENNFGKIPKPIGSTGLGFQKIGGGIYGIDKIWKEKTPSTTIVATVDIVDIISPFKVKGYPLFTAKDLTTTIDLWGIDFSGDAYIYFIDVGDVGASFSYTYGGYINANLNIDDILIMDAYMSITKDNFEAYLNGDVYFPKGTPFVGGEKLTGFSAGMSLEKIWGSTEFLGCSVGVKYYWEDSDFDFDVDLLSMFGKADGITYPIENGKGLYSMRSITTDGREMQAVFGSNFEVIDNRSPMLAFNGDIREFAVKELYAKSSTLTYKEYDVDIFDVETVLLKIDYNDEIPYLEVIKPDGSSYELRSLEDNETNPNYHKQVIAAEDSLSGVEEKSIYISIQAPSEGTWVVKSDKDIILTPYNVKDSPKFTSFIVENDEVLGGLWAKWDVTTDKDSRISLYLTEDNEIRFDRPIVEDIDASEGEWLISIDEEISGEYQVVAVVTREDFGYDTAISNSLIINNPTMETPTGFKVEAIGNGYMKASWNYDLFVGPYSLEGWILQVVDENGVVDPSIGDQIFISGDSQTEVVLGGVLTDDNGNPYGWFPNRDYTFSLTTVGWSGSYEDRTLHYSSPAISDTVFLSDPEPAIIHAQISSPNGIVTDGGLFEGIETKYINSNLLNLDVELDKEANVEVYQNSNKVNDFFGTQGSTLINLNSGINEISIKVTANNGDISEINYIIISDSEAPYLMIESPNRALVITEDTFLVSGKTEVDALLTINGQETSIGPDGSFNQVMNMTEVKDTINIKALDAAGNMTNYLAEVWNNSIGEIEGVVIEPSNTEIENGYQQQFELFGITEAGEQKLIDSTMVNWEIVEGSEIATITKKGILAAKAVGEVILKASYYINEDFALEDAVPVKIIPQTSMPPSKEVVMDVKINPNYSEIYKGSSQQFKLYGITNYNKESLINSEEISWEIIGDSNIATVSMNGILFGKQEGEVTLKGIYSNGEGDIIEDEVKVKILPVVKDNEQGKTKRQKADYMNENNLIVMKDMENHWAKDAVNKLVAMGIINGIKLSNNEFIYNPEGLITRAEFSKLLAGVQGIKIEEVNIKELKNVVDWDQVPTWAQPYMAYCYNNGWINGVPKENGTYFKANEPITRAEVAAMVGRTIEKINNERVSFGDIDKIPAWGLEYVDILASLKIINGYPDNSFKPERKMTRAEAAVLFEKLINYRN